MAIIYYSPEIFVFYPRKVVLRLPIQQKMLHPIWKYNFVEIIRNFDNNLTTFLQKWNFPGINFIMNFKNLDLANTSDLNSNNTIIRFGSSMLWIEYDIMDPIIIIWVDNILLHNLSETTFYKWYDDHWCVWNNYNIFVSLVKDDFLRFTYNFIINLQV